MKNVNVRQLFDYDTWTYTYLVWCTKTKDCLLIDPVYNQVNRDLELIKKLKLNLIYIFETHVHADHITSANLIKNKTNAKICYGSNTGVKGADIYLKDSQEIFLGELLFKVMHTPGHTIGCVSYYVDGFLFTGDTLFIGGTGRTDFQGGSAENTYDSVTKKIFTYSDDTIIYPGHNYQGLTCSTVLEEKQTNPNVGINVSKEQFVENEKNIKRPYPKKFDVAVPANMECGLKE